MFFGPRRGRSGGNGLGRRRIGEWFDANQRLDKLRHLRNLLKMDRVDGERENEFMPARNRAGPFEKFGYCQ